MLQFLKLLEHTMLKICHIYEAFKILPVNIKVTP